ncbi:hypothetical protein Ga0609869_000495 [Rhodovulum iodosum]|uniref:Heme NO-binding domain-containing protein n=1 Tax=Rhodovulum iodosum TaxID=68291 RepID=A0ABV3XPB1_9RHOB|nr:heme NO-binding domain-containing protein [Rhodovulum robiginosum]RSK31557.1 heme NO-binding protein [Rhodovulum robiginosum]
MHGLINRSIQCFVQDTYGAPAWRRVAEAAGVGPEGFEALLSYEDALTERVLDALQAYLDKPRDMVLEDLGTYLVSHPTREGLRRLLRFGGETFLEFLHSLDDLAGRARLAVPELDLPELTLVAHDGGRFTLVSAWHMPWAAPLVMGVLRAMADDYGALVLLEPETGAPEHIMITLLDSRFAEGRAFALGRA